MTTGVWRNWAGNQRWSPAAVARPAGTEEIVEAVKAAPGRVKVVGTGHSFTDAAATDGTLVSLTRHRRLLAVDRERARVTVEAGMTLAELNVILALYGLALPNLGDIEYQTVAGALATGTHGTGARFGCLATVVTGLELVTADGAVHSLGPGDDGFGAAQVSLGALGVVSALTLQCVPSFNLRAVEGPMRFDEAVDRFDELAEANAHMELYWVPGSRSVWLKRNNPADGPPGGRSRVREWFDDTVVQNTAFGLIGKVHRRSPSAARRLARRLPKPRPVDYVDRSDRVFTSPRTVRFVEMEYGVDRTLARPVLTALRDALRSHRVGFPIEVRVTAADDIPLSMASGRPSLFVACHVFAGHDHTAYFAAAEEILAGAGGRPHWGKLHTQTAATLAPRYPQWDAFARARDRLDPERRFANAYTDRVL